MVQIFIPSYAECVQLNQEHTRNLDTARRSNQFRLRNAKLSRRAVFEEPRRFRLRNKKMPRPDVVEKPARFRLRNAKYQPPSTALVGTEQLCRLISSDGSQIQEDSWDDVIQFASMPDASTELASKADVEKHIGLNSPFADSWEDVISFAMKKRCESDEHVSEVDTQSLSETETQTMIDKVSSCSEDEQVVDQTFEIQFEGSWNQARISREFLTWNEGEVVHIEALSATTFAMNYVGKSYHAELRSDGKLYWNDGDIWTLRTEKVENSTSMMPPPQSQRSMRNHRSAICDSVVMSESQQCAEVHKRLPAMGRDAGLAQSSALESSNPENVPKPVSSSFDPSVSKQCSAKAVSLAPVGKKV
jgi:hypothetical protein